jgi:hypothetical protein
MILALRLRQAASHPFLLEHLMKTVFGLEDIKWLIERLKSIQNKTPFITQIGRWCEEQLQLRQGPELAHQTATTGTDRLDFTGKFDMVPHLERVMKEMEGTNQNLCRRCGSIPDDGFAPEVRLSDHCTALQDSTHPPCQS